MALAEQSRVREIVTGSTSDSSQDTLIAAKMTEADQQVADKLYIYAQNHGKIKALPVIDVTNALIGGFAVPQHMKDAASNLAASLCFKQMHQFDTAKEYMALANTAIEGYVLRLNAESGETPVAII